MADAVWARLRQWARSIKRDVIALYVAARDPRTPVIAKVVAGLVAAYALSPIDLIPDFIPVLGLVDDAILIPAGVWLFERLMPPGRMAEHRAAAEAAAHRPTSWAGLLIVIALWLLAIVLAWSFVRWMWD